METDIKLTKLAKCAGCGAKVGAGTLAKLLEGFKTRTDENLIVGYDKSDDACVYKVNEDVAMIETLDFFPPIVDDPYLYGQIAAANSLSDIYAMGGEPKLALNIMAVTAGLSDDSVREILRGGYDKAYEAGAIICGGHTIQSEEPLYGLSVTGFARPENILTNASAKIGDRLILTKILGAGIMTTAAKAGIASQAETAPVYRQMAVLNRAARDIMVKYNVHSCTDVTGFALIGHSYEMAEGSEASIHITSESIRYFPEAYEYAKDGLIPEGAYRNRAFAGKGTFVSENVPIALEDILYDPQTSGGLLFALPEGEADVCLKEMQDAGIPAFSAGYVTAPGEYRIYVD